MTFQAQQVPFPLSGIVMMFALASCGGGGSGGGPQQLVGNPGTGNTPKPGPLKISTSFGTTKTDYYPLDAKFSRIGEDPNCCWNMEYAESRIASRENVWAMLQENVYELELDPPKIAQHGDRIHTATGTIYGYLQPPIVRFVEGPISRTATMRAIDNINAWLPWDKHITVGSDIGRPMWLKHNRNYQYLPAGDLLEPNGIVVDLDAPEANFPRGAAATSNAIYSTRNTSGATWVIQHELLHVLGLVGGRACAETFGADCNSNSSGGSMFYLSHVPVSKFPESSMAYASPYDDTHGLSQIDGEAIQAIYTREAFREIVNEHYRRSPFGDDEEIRAWHPGQFAITPENMSFDDLSPWDDTVLRYSGSIEGWHDSYFCSRGAEFCHGGNYLYPGKPAFGVDWRNGLARPWTVGDPPYSTFAESGLSGTATWNGELVGFTPAREAVHGDSAVNVNLIAMTGNAVFTALEHWNAGAAPGQRGTGMQWNDGDLHYSLALDGNYLRSRSNGGDEGYVSGRFVGPKHRGAVGILERPDLTGAFGAVRE